MKTSCCHFNSSGMIDLIDQFRIIGAAKSNILREYSCTYNITMAVNSIYPIDQWDL